MKRLFANKCSNYIAIIIRVQSIVNMFFLKKLLLSVFADT